MTVELIEGHLFGLRKVKKPIAVGTTVDLYRFGSLFGSLATKTTLTVTSPDQVVLEDWSKFPNENAWTRSTHLEPQIREREQIRMYEGFIGWSDIAKRMLTARTVGRYNWRP